MATPQENIAVWANLLELSASRFHGAKARCAKLIFIIVITLMQNYKCFGQIEGNAVSSSLQDPGGLALSRRIQRLEDS